MYGDLTITVIIPCLNEEQGIDAVLGRMPDYVDEVIVVDNGCDRPIGRRGAFPRRQSHPGGCTRLRPSLQEGIRQLHRRCDCYP